MKDLSYNIRMSLEHRSGWPSNSRERRAFAHAIIAQAKSNPSNLELINQAEEAVKAAGDSKKSRTSGFERSLAHLSAISHLDPKFGNSWNEIASPIVGAVVFAIDEDGDNQKLSRLGLSAMQLTNLGIERISRPLNAESLVFVMQQNAAGLLDSQDYGSMRVTKAGLTEEALIYNAFGPRSNRKSGRSGIRISKPLAETLRVKLGDRVALIKP